MRLHEFLEENEVTQALKSQGKSKNQSDNNYDPIELEIGIEVEYEHVDNEEQSKEIAKDHLEENPHYYTQVLAPSEDEVMVKAKKILKKHGYNSIEDYLSKNEGVYSKKISSTTSKPFMRSAVINFFKKLSSAPNDSELHKWAERHNFNVNEVESEIYKLAHEHIRKHMK